VVSSVDAEFFKLKSHLRFPLSGFLLFVIKTGDINALRLKHRAHAY
jgi:hypothetical protein